MTGSGASISARPASGQVLGKVRKLLGPELDAGFESALEIGAGTGYFSLNLMRAGADRRAHVHGHLVRHAGRALRRNADRLGLAGVRGYTADAESLPFADDSFDLVLGHAVLHHLPDLDRAFAEFHRVLRPGGRIVFAGEPSRVGDRIARVPKRAALLLAPLWRRALHARPALDPAHAPTRAGRAPTTSSRARSTSTPSPPPTSRVAAGAGFTDVTVRGEELVANWFGWFNRSSRGDSA